MGKSEEEPQTPEGGVRYGCFDRLISAHHTSLISGFNALCVVGLNSTSFLLTKYQREVIFSVIGRLRHCVEGGEII
jgi:hypothetical protein